MQSFALRLARVLTFTLAASPGFTATQIYSYKDDCGTPTFTTEWDSIPQQYRSRVVPLAFEGDEEWRSMGCDGCSCAVNRWKTLSACCRTASGWVEEGVAGTIEQPSNTRRLHDIDPVF